MCFLIKIWFSFIHLILIWFKFLIFMMSDRPWAVFGVLQKLFCLIIMFLSICSGQSWDVGCQNPPQSAPRGELLQPHLICAKCICLSTLDIALTNTKAMSFDLGFWFFLYRFIRPLLSFDLNLFLISYLMRFYNRPWVSFS